MPCASHALVVAGRVYYRSHGTSSDGAQPFNLDLPTAVPPAWNVEVVIGCVTIVLVLHILGAEWWWFPVPTAVPPQNHHTHHPRCSGVDEQGGEFAFVAFGMAERLGIIEPQLCKLLLTTVAISMAATPALSNFSAWVADQVHLSALRRLRRRPCVCCETLSIKERRRMRTPQRQCVCLCSTCIWRCWDALTCDDVFSLPE